MTVWLVGWLSPGRVVCSMEWPTGWLISWLLNPLFACPPPPPSPALHLHRYIILCLEDTNDFTNATTRHLVMQVGVKGEGGMWVHFQMMSIGGIYPALPLLIPPAPYPPSSHSSLLLSLNSHNSQYHALVFTPIH